MPCIRIQMAKIDLHKLVRYSDSLLKTEEIEDYKGAVNGLQVTNQSGYVSRIAACVDASLATVKKAISAHADLLLVHHGLFWSPLQPLIGPKFELVSDLIHHNLAVYSSHLPLDMHPKLGNNAQLCQSLKLAQLKPFFHTKGVALGLQGIKTIKRSNLSALIEASVGHPPLLIPGGPESCRKIGVVTGGAGAELALAASEGVDTFITGEGPHWTYALAEEKGINVFYAGHYATETFGVKALAGHLSKKFHLDWLFIDHPTGL